MIILTLAIMVFMFIKPKKKYDEYQISIISRSLIIAGILSVLMIPVIMILLLSDPSYVIETIFLFAAVQWLGVLLSDMIYVIKY
jgi:hypothetical protein